MLPVTLGRPEIAVFSERWLEKVVPASCWHEFIKRHRDILSDCEFLTIELLVITLLIVILVFVDLPGIEKSGAALRP